MQACRIGWGILLWGCGDHECRHKTGVRIARERFSHKLLVYVGFYIVASCMAIAGWVLTSHRTLMAIL